ncbi:putative phage abortive infection protein [Flavobacterium fluviale]|nr:putative phage abortive infection protein [Flavobacterium fluviale]
MDATGQFGDFIGGVIGTILSGAGFYFLYITLVEQRKSIQEQKEALENQKISFEKERFEAKFFDLIKLHRDNITDVKYRIFIKEKKETVEGRRVFNLIYKEFLESFLDVKRFCKIYEGEVYTKRKYRKKLNRIIKENNLKTTINDLVIIDISYLILYFGTGKEGAILLRHKFTNRYTEDFVYKLIKFIQLKPCKSNTEGYKSWNKFKATELPILKRSFNRIYRNRNNKAFSFTIKNYNLLENYKSVKYYGGHQYRLGHYYRHLFQCYKFLILQKTLNESEKYFYGKTLRAQLSNYEQSLLFVNSISSLGYKWEFDHEHDLEGQPIRLITFFQLIKNVSGRRLVNIDYRDFYKINYEFEER